MDRWLVVLCGVLGFVGVALGAFGDHALEAVFAAAADGADRARWWDTAVRYQMVHALALGLCAWLATQTQSKAPRVAGAAFALGVLIFSGTLYAMALGAPRFLGAITPIGGVSLLVGWAALVRAGLAAAPNP